MFFANPLFLLGLLAVAIPIAVHLFNFRRYRKIYFSNVARIEELQAETRQQSTLRRWLILAARILVVVFLVLAFAQPVIPNGQQPMRRGGVAVSVYMDNSFSMENTNAEGTLIEAAKRKAREIAAAYKPSDQFQLLTNDADGSQFRWQSRDEFLAALDEVGASATTVTLSEMARKQHDFLHASRAGNLYAYQISDFQRAVADWETFPIDTTVSTTFVPLAGVAVNNIFIDSVSLGAPAFYKGSTVAVDVFLRNAGDSAVAALPVRLFANGQQRALTTVDLPANGSAKASMLFKIESDNAQHCYVETSDYPITFDDRMYFSVNVSRHVDMLVVNGTDENPYLHRLFAEDSAIRYSAVSAHSIDFSTLSNHQFIVLNELADIPSGLTQTLHEFVALGGTLLVVPAVKADTESYNRLLAQLNAPLLGDFVDQEVKSNGINVEDGLFRNVFAKKPSDIELPTVHGCYRLVSNANSVVSPLVSLADGGMFLSYTTGADGGRVFLFASPLQTRFTDFVQQALFVPTLYNMALYSQPPMRPYSLLGSNAAIPLPLAVSAEAVKLRQIDGTLELIPELRRMAGRSVLYPHGKELQAGAYRLVLPDSELAMAFNYARQESEMTFWDAAAVRSAIKDYHLEGCSVVRNTERSVEDFVRQQHEGRPLWHWCLAAALLMLLAEELLIRFGGRTQRRAGVSES